MAVTSTSKIWLLKAEPDSRVVKGKDVKFSVDDFEAVGVSPWEGVRNYEARNLMKEMSVGDQALFYHSNCKNPGIAAFAEVAKEAYPDHTAWESSHPYYDSKSEEASPKWFMVDLKFTSRVTHFVSLALLKWIKSQSDPLPEKIAYIGKDGLEAIKNMNLLNRGRLSVQSVTDEAWTAISLLAENGGWDDAMLKAKPKATPKRKVATKKKKATDYDEYDSSEEEVMPKSKKRKAPSPVTEGDLQPKRRSARGT